ncbi:hypothetical protein [Roseibium polysiphoniae]|nr:hypothetical protein [Roseibium polysiphoniae]
MRPDHLHQRFGISLRLGRCVARHMGPVRHLWLAYRRRRALRRIPDELIDDVIKDPQLRARESERRRARPTVSNWYWR